VQCNRQWREEGACDGQQAERWTLPSQPHSALEEGQELQTGNSSIPTTELQVTGQGNQGKCFEATTVLHAEAT